MVNVAQSDSHGVGGVGGLRGLGQPKGAAHHLLDLLLAGAAIPGESALHLSSGVVMQRNVVHSGGEADNATGMPHENCGTGMLVMRVELLERHDIGSVILEKLGDELNLSVSDDPSPEVLSPENYTFNIGIKPQPSAQTLAHLRRDWKLLSAAVFLGYQRWGAPQSTAREELLSQLPSDASAVIFLDFEELRRAVFRGRHRAPRQRMEGDCIPAGGGMAGW